MFGDLDVGIAANAAVGAGAGCAVDVVEAGGTVGCDVVVAKMCRCGAVECVGHLWLAKRLLETVVVVVVVGAAHRFVVVVGDGENDGGSWVGYLNDVNCGKAILKQLANVIY